MADTKLSALTTITPVVADSFYILDATDGSSKRVLLSALDTLLSATTKTLTNKTINLASNTLTWTLAEFNTAVSDATLVSTSWTPVNNQVWVWTADGVLEWDAALTFSAWQLASTSGRFSWASSIHLWTNNSLQWQATFNCVANTNTVVLVTWTPTWNRTVTLPDATWTLVTSWVTALSSLVTVSALDSWSITSWFWNIDNWTSTLDTGVVTCDTIRAAWWLEVNAQTWTTYWIVAADEWKVITMTNAAASTITIPANWTIAMEVWTIINIEQHWAGQVTVAITSDTLNSASSNVKLTGQYSACYIRKVSATVWILVGDLSA